MRLRRVLHLVAMFAKAKARVRQFAGMDQVTCVDPVMDARFNRFQGMEKGLSTVYDAMGAYFAAHKALSRASTELSTALEAYHMDAIKAYSENELDNAVESSDACDPVASEARTSAMVACNAGLDLCRLLDAQAQQCAPVHESMLKDVMIRPVAAALASLPPSHTASAAVLAMPQAAGCCWHRTATTASPGTAEAAGG